MKNWKVVEPSNEYLVIDTGIDSSILVERLDNDSGIDHDIANLVAAAPNLLVIAEHSLELIQSLAPVFGMVGDEQVKQAADICETIKMVIAKAKGRR